MVSETLRTSIQQAYSRFLNHKNLKARYGQKLMIAAIARQLGNITLDDKGRRDSASAVAVVEAGTGTGKTVAYLMAALPIAHSLQKKLVVSTATVALQEQILIKDLPDLVAHSGLQFTTSLAKGRGRYLCLSKLDRILVANSEDTIMPGFDFGEPAGVSGANVQLYEKMVEALAANQWNGERDTWPEDLEDDQWGRVTTDHFQCTGRNCENVNSCSFFKAREGLASSDCIITNHDLVLADLALGGGAILPPPEECIYVFDEGHHLADKAIDHFAHHSRLIATRKWLEQFAKSRDQMAEEIGDLSLATERIEEIGGHMDACREALLVATPLFAELADTASANEQTRRHRFPSGELPDDIIDCSKVLADTFEDLAESLENFAEFLAECLEERHLPVARVDAEANLSLVSGWLARAQGNRDLWKAYARPQKKDAPPDARWITTIDGVDFLDFEVCTSPILAAEALRNALWKRCCGAVVTSATLSSLGRFDRLLMRLGLPKNTTCDTLPSPFDFANAGTIAIPAAAVDAGKASEHTESVIGLLPSLLKPFQGNLVLFASRRQMLEVFEGLAEALQEQILMQGQSSKQLLLDQHREKIDRGEQSILFGLASFAEGVDLPGHYCNHVIIAKIPFSVPDDPVDATLAEWIEERGGNAFMEISVPDAALKLVQACGRLLRSEQDQGRITVLDNRLISRRYGKLILDSLPPFRREINR